MAVLIPENLRSNKKVPEPIRHAAGALHMGLDDDVTIWYEPLFDLHNQRPHLVVLEPRVGLVMVEVVTFDVLGGLRGKLHLNVDGDEVEVESPLRRAEEFAVAFRDAVDARPAVAHVPVASVAVFPKLTREQADEMGVGKVVDLNHCLFKRDLDVAREDGGGAGLLRVFHRARDRSLDVELTAAQVDEVRGVVHPDVVINAKPIQGALFSASQTSDDVMLVMDRKQESMAKTMGSGHRVIRGVAGSGKTLVLVHRARTLASLLPSKKVLVTCYTKSLASQLRGQLADCSNVDVRNLDKVMSEVLSRAGVKHPGYSDPSAVAREALRALDANPNSPKFRAVLVDEAQDFYTEALQFCVRLLESTDPDEQDLIIVADSAQNIFRRDFNWKSAGINAQGRTKYLRVNYRNTKEILSFAYAFLTEGAALGGDAQLDFDDEAAIIPPEAAERSGSEPRVVAAKDRADEVAQVVDAVKQYMGSRSRARSIAVLHGDGAQSLATGVAKALADSDLPFFWVTEPGHEANKDLAGSTDAPIVLSTIKSAKGLEFPAVVVFGLGAADELDPARKLAYVGFTRAVNDLTVVVGTDSPFRGALLASTDKRPDNDSQRRSR